MEKIKILKNILYEYVEDEFIEKVVGELQEKFLSLRDDPKDLKHDHFWEENRKGTK